MKILTYILTSVSAAAMIMMGCSMTRGQSVTDSNIKNATVKKNRKNRQFL